MLTTRGIWFFVAVLALTGLALGSGSKTLALACLALLIWFLGQWFWFAVRVRLAQGRWTIRRQLQDERSTLQTLWARQHASARITLTCESFWGFPYVLAIDRVPPLARVEEGRFHAEGQVSRGQPLELIYRLVCPTPGLLLFLGLKIHLADRQGFFQATFFLRDFQRIRVLPALADARAQLQGGKRHNLIPLKGSHRHRREGGGSELLEVRDYRTGDPPKMIAWKASARRGRLMSKVYESEVPIRCTLFVDASGSTRLGPPGRTPLARLVEVAAMVVQANAAARDLTGLCWFDDQGRLGWIKPKRGPKHVVTLMDRLAEMAALTAATRLGPLERYLPLAYGLVQEIYPELLDDDVNAFPRWLPFFSPRPAYTVPRSPVSPRTWSGKLGKYLLTLFQDSPLALSPKSGRRFSPQAHRLYRWRKKLAAILSVRYGLAPAGLARLLEDDWDCFHYVQRFLGEHQIVCPTPLYDDLGRYLFTSEAKWPPLARALTTAIQAGRDNELFVILADFLEAGSKMGSLQKAVRMGLARHHQVMIICPWPASVPLPQRSGRGGPGKPILRANGSDPLTLQDYLWQASTVSLHQAFEKVRQIFAPMGIPVICAQSDEAPALVLHRINVLRQQEGGVR